MALVNDLAGAWATDALADAAFVAAGWAKSDGVQYYDSTLEVIKRWDASLAEWIVEAAPARWEDLRINQFTPRTSPGVLAAFSATPAGHELDSWSFPNNTTDRSVSGCTQFPHAALPTSDAYLHIHMSTTAAVAAGTDIGLFCSVMVQKIDDPIASAYIKLLWLKRTAPVGGWGAKTHIMTESYTLPAANLGVSAMIFVDVFRHKGTLYTTDNAGDVTEAIDDVLWLHELDIHYQATRLGTDLPP